MQQMQFTQDAFSHSVCAILKCFCRFYMHQTDFFCHRNVSRFRHVGQTEKRNADI